MNQGMDQNNCCQEADRIGVLMQLKVVYAHRIGSG